MRQKITLLASHCTLIALLRNISAFAVLLARLVRASCLAFVISLGAFCCRNATLDSLARTDSPLSPTHASPFETAHVGADHASAAGLLRWNFFDFEERCSLCARWLLRLLTCKNKAKTVTYKPNDCKGDSPNSYHLCASCDEYYVPCGDNAGNNSFLGWCMVI